MDMKEGFADIQELLAPFLRMGMHSDVTLMDMLHEHNHGKPKEDKRVVENCCSKKDNTSAFSDFNLEKLSVMPNPIVPLKFEKYGNDPSISLKDNVELHEEMKAMGLGGKLSVVACEKSTIENMGSFQCYQTDDPVLKKAHLKAIDAYDARDPVRMAHDALEIHHICPEAYNVLAVHSADSYAEALELYNKAVKCAEKLDPDFKELLKDDPWRSHYARPYIRAVHGQANTLRKMGRYKESRERYMHLHDIDKDIRYGSSSYVNWRFHLLEVFMKLGDDKTAWKWVERQDQRKTVHAMSSQAAWLWSIALLQYRYKDQKSFPREYCANSDEDPHNMDGAIIHAFGNAPHVMDYLTGKKKLPYSPISSHIKSPGYWTNQIAYVHSNLELWQNTPGAIEWARKCCNTVLALHSLSGVGCGEVIESKIPKTHAEFKQLIKDGVYYDEWINPNGTTLVHVSVYSDDRDKLSVLLKAGASPNPIRPWVNPVETPLQKAYFLDVDPAIIKLLIRHGADPLCSNTQCYGIKNFTEIPLEMAVSMGHARAVYATLTCLKDKLPLKTLDKLFNILVKSECYLCVKGKKECALCKFCMCGSSFTHAKTNNFEACISALFAGGYKVLDIQLSLLGRTLTAARQPLLQYARKESKHPKKYHQEKLESLYPELVILCSHCGEKKDKLQKCSRCMEVYYCSKECQKNDWNQHKSVCCVVDKNNN